MDRKEVLAAMMTATVASPLVPVLAGETELPVKTVDEIDAGCAAQTQKMIDDGTVTLILTN